MRLLIWQAKVNALPAQCSTGRLLSQTQEELSPALRFGDASRDALLPSVLQP